MCHGFESHPLRQTVLARHSREDFKHGELAESVEGARLLSEYTGQNLYRGFESLALRHTFVLTALSIDAKVIVRS